MSKQLNLPIDKIIELYKQGISSIKLAQTYGCSDSCIRNWLHKNNVTMTTNKTYRRTQQFDENFFEQIDTEEKAYWLGFMYADGCVRQSKRGQHRIQISVTDKEIIDKFITSIHGNMTTKTYNTKVARNGIVYNITLISTKMYNDLCSHGCVPKKSLILQFPQLPKELIRHFIRGYFDGDGCVCAYQNKYISQKKRNPTIKYRSRLSVDFTGTYNMIQTIASYLNIPSIRKEKRRTSEVYYCSTGKIDTVQNIYKYMYEGATVYLSRKKQKFDENLQKDVQRL